MDIEINRKLKDIRKQRSISKITSKNYEATFYNFDNPSEENLLKEGGAMVLYSIMHHTFSTLPKKSITQKVLLQKSTKDGIPMINLLAQVAHSIPDLKRNNPFKNIPKEVLTEELLSTRGDNEESVYHELADSKILYLLPKELITRKALLLNSKIHGTVLHKVAMNEAHLIPEDITLDDILTKDNVNFTPLHCWVCSNHWADIPERFLTKESIGVRNMDGCSPFDYILERFKQDKSYGSWDHDIKAKAKVKTLLNLIDHRQLNHLSSNSEYTSNPTLKILVNQEITKRKVLEELSKNEQSIEI
jgi:hypothetical protein